MSERSVSPAQPQFQFSVGVTGHRAAHAGYAAAAAGIAQTIESIFGMIDAAVARTRLLSATSAPSDTRLVTLLVDGTDQLAAIHADQLGWELLSPLPFGRALNLAINALPEDGADARALLAGQPPADAATRKRMEAIEAIAARAQLFELADQDRRIERLYLAMLDAPQDFARAQEFAREGAKRAALAGQVLIEQSDLLIAVWDGGSTANIGGAGDTVLHALEVGAPVIWIDPAAPSDWRILRATESLAAPPVPIAAAARTGAIEEIVGRALSLPDLAVPSPLDIFLGERWHPTSARIAHAYRRVEALFDGSGRRLRNLTQRYELPKDIEAGSGAALLGGIRAMPEPDPAFADRVGAIALRNLAWADGISTRYSDAYRGGMVLNFVLSALAIVGGALYLPLQAVVDKWPFAVFELLLLLSIIVTTAVGQRRHWHTKWFESRRVAEYLRHSPLMLMLGSARPPGLWPRATGSAWPESYVRHALRSIGLPRSRITPAYLRAALKVLLDCHVVPQRDYHFEKARRLKRVHHNLDRFSEWLFACAVLAVTTYLVLKAFSVAGRIDHHLVESWSKVFTVLGVAFPTFGAAVAGIRYFGDFDRFSAISQVTAEKLDSIHGRAQILSAAADDSLHYGNVTALIHSADDVVISEIESWQSVFGGKDISIPV